MYNYFLYEGKYYIVDFSWYIFGGYALSQDFPVLKLDRLEDYTGDTIGQLYGGVSLAIAHTSTGRHLPNIFGEQYDEPYYYVPEGSEYTLLYAVVMSVLYVASFMIQQRWVFASDKKVKEKV